MMYSFPCSVGLEKSSGDWKRRELLPFSLSLSSLLFCLCSLLVVLDSRVFPLTKRKLFPSSPLFSHARSCFARNTFPPSLPETERDRRPFSWNQDRFIEESRRNDLGGRGNFHFNNSNRSSMRTHHHSRMTMKKRYMEKGVEEEQFTNEFTNFVFTWKIETKDFSLRQEEI